MALIGYARVSILEEETWLQHDALEAAGCKRVFTDRASGGAEERPELARLFDHLREGDTLVVTRLDRIGRSLRDLIDTVATLAERGVGLRSLDAALDTTGAKGKAVVAVCAALAEFELDILRERTALAAVGVREPREPRLGSLVEAARSLPHPARRRRAGRDGRAEPRRSRRRRSSRRRRPRRRSRAAPARRAPRGSRARGPLPPQGGRAAAEAAPAAAAPAPASRPAGGAGPRRGRSGVRGAAGRAVRRPARRRPRAHRLERRRVARRAGAAGGARRRISRWRRSGCAIRSSCGRARWAAR